ncbi:DUF1648 domain-containing protein [Nonomuraea phyllanthi]|uniref:DUF1648 domain-containing protein n=1 Tax=Nonomuraea phyllanthi TaxID=2219224 RepID=A0A5C4WB08_9ACTN|nr:DUF1648 domain-containing protein [Nonomuraea phyllanthi]KAB8192703.1 DUF1648 domain-containing protein [Nonomuraea phyllanthi]QFY08180.1 DUF1648 domain-containing protein [Nonomuraea phyllanthi]
MNPRAISVIWGLAVTAVQIALPLSLRDRLPDPLATHWGTGGTANGSMSFTAYVAVQALVWAVPWLVALAMNERVRARRHGRMTWWGAQFGLGLFLPGLNVTTLLANLDAPDWTAARLPGWQVVAVVVAGFGVAALAGYLGRGGHDDPAPPGRVPPRLRLRAGQRTVWIGHVTNRTVSLLTAVAVAALAVLGLLGLAGLAPGEQAAALVPGLAIVLVVGLLTSSLSVQVGDGHVVVRLGPLGLPARRISLSRIESAWSETRYPSQVGGWGFRGLPGGTTIMLRGGECLVIGYRSGGRLAISVDDATRGASLINALITERVEP